MLLFLERVFISSSSLVMRVEFCSVEFGGLIWSLNG